MFPDTFNATINGKHFHSNLDENWRIQEFIPKVQKRGAEIIGARGLSSAASAGNAAIAHMRDWHLGSQGKWVSMGILAEGDYGINKGLIYSFPVTVENGKYSIVEGITIGEEQRERMKFTEDELIKEREFVDHLLN